MQYALLACAPPGDTDRAARPVPGSLAALLGVPVVLGKFPTDLPELRDRML